MKFILLLFVFCLITAEPNLVFAQTIAPEAAVPMGSPTPGAVPNTADATLASSESKYSHPHYSLTGAITVPQPITLGVQLNWDSVPQLQAFFEGGYFRYALQSGRVFSEFSFSGGIHYHPWMNWFYVGGSLGYRHLGFIADISSLKTDTGDVIASNAQLSLNALFLGLFIGGEWKWSERLSFGVDLGAQLAILHGGSINILPNPGSPNYNLAVSYQQTTDRLSGFPIPQLALARFIYHL